jgi:Ca2+/Na+ antiporter
LASKSQAESGKRSKAPYVLGAWALLVSLFFFWESVEYTGLTGWLAELQFAYLGTYFPVVTYLLFVALFSIPVFIYALYSRRKERRQADPEERAGGRALAASSRRMRSLFGVAAGIGVAAFIALLVTLFLPDSKGGTQRIVVGSEAALSPAEGPSSLAGNHDLKLTARHTVSLPFLGRDTYFVPVSGSVGNRKVVQYFAETERLGEKPVYFSPVKEGVLRKNALPGEILALYKDAGLTIGSPHYVLFKSVESMRSRHVMVTAQLTLLAILILLLGFIQQWRRNRLKRKISETI